MYFWLFLTEPVGVNENLRSWEAPEGGLNPQPPDKSSTDGQAQWLISGFLKGGSNFCWPLGLTHKEGRPNQVILFFFYGGKKFFLLKGGPWPNGRPKLCHWTGLRMNRQSGWIEGWMIHIDAAIVCISNSLHKCHAMFTCNVLSMEG